LLNAFHCFLDRLETREIEWGKFEHRERQLKYGELPVPHTMPLGAIHY
jgi:hypothetical protein